MLIIGISGEIKSSDLENKLAERRSELETAGEQLQGIVKLFDDSQEDMAELNLLKQISSEQTLNSELLHSITETLSSRIWLTQIKVLGGSELTELTDKYKTVQTENAEDNKNNGKSGSDTEDHSAEEYISLLNEMAVYLQTGDTVTGSEGQGNNDVLQQYDLMLQGEARTLASVTGYYVYLRELPGIEKAELLDCHSVKESEDSRSKLVHFRIWVSCELQLNI